MRILIVEDEPKLSAFVKRGLQSGYAVDAIGDGATALEYAETDPYDLIIMDPMLPLSAARICCSACGGRNFCVPVLVLTARDAVQEKVKLFDLGADDYLTRLFAFAELPVRVKLYCGAALSVLDGYF